MAIQFATAGNYSLGAKLARQNMPRSVHFAMGQKWSLAVQALEPSITVRLVKMKILSKEV